jgi:hypothetical protein
MRGDAREASMLEEGAALVRSCGIESDADLDHSPTPPSPSTATRASPAVPGMAEAGAWVLLEPPSLTCLLTCAGCLNPGGDHSAARLDLRAASDERGGSSDAVARRSIRLIPVSTNKRLPSPAHYRRFEMIPASPGTRDRHRGPRHRPPLVSQIDG